MIKIKDFSDTRADIECTNIDTFMIEVGSDEGTNLNGKTLLFQIGKCNNDIPIISKSYTTTENNGELFYNITLSTEDMNLLSVNNYMYRLSLRDGDGKIITTKSGKFLVKWGA